MYRGAEPVVKSRAVVQHVEIQTRVICRSPRTGRHQDEPGRPRPEPPG
jgi:hypothetical protein